MRPLGLARYLYSFDFIGPSLNESITYMLHLLVTVIFTLLSGRFLYISESRREIRPMKNTCVGVCMFLRYETIIFTFVGSPTPKLDLLAQVLLHHAKRI